MDSDHAGDRKHGGTLSRTGVKLLCNVNAPLIGDAEGLSLRLCDRLSEIDAPCAPRVDL